MGKNRTRAFLQFFRLEVDMIGGHRPHLKTADAPLGLDTSKASRNKLWTLRGKLPEKLVLAFRLLGKKKHLPQKKHKFSRATMTRNQQSERNPCHFIDKLAAKADTKNEGNTGNGNYNI